MNVRFFAGTKADYLNLPVPKNPLGLYFCADTQELFWADRLLTDGVRVVSTQQDLPELQSAAEGIIYYVTETRNGYVLAPDKSKWLQTIYAPVTDASKVPEDEIYSTVPTVGAVRDIENKIHNTVNSLDARVADIELSISDTGIKAISFAGYDLAKTADGVFTIDRANARRSLGFIVPEGQELDEIEFATKTFVENRLESIQSINPDEYAKLADLENFVARPEIDTLIANKADKEHTHTEYLTAIPSEYITEAELDNKGYLTQHQSLDGFATEAWVESKNYLTIKQSLSTYATKEELANAINSIDHPTVDLTEYVTKTELDGFIKEIPAEYVTETELTAKGYLTEQNLSSYATESFVNEAIANIDIPKVNTEDFVTLETFTQTLENKANEIPFDTDKFVTNPIGNFVAGETLKGLSIAEIFAKILGLSDTIIVPEEPEGIIATIMKNELPMYTVTADGDVLKLNYKYLKFTEDTATSEATESGFYQIVNSAGDVIESGYQELQVNSDETYYVIALPKDIDYNTMVSVKAWNALEGCWTDTGADKPALTSDPNIVTVLCDEAGIDISHISPEYTIWATDSTPDGSKYRFIIHE